jgi:hypothetical protein
VLYTRRTKGCPRTLVDDIVFGICAHAASVFLRKIGFYVTYRKSENEKKTIL